MAADDAVTITLRANLKEYEAALKTAVRQTEKAAAAAEKALGDIGSKARLTKFQDNTRDAGRSMQAAQADAKNLGFQFNDLATSIASGGGAMRALSQQGGQISQIFSGMGIKAAGATITTALLDPFVAIPVAISLAGIAFASFFSDTESGAEAANKALKEQIRILGEIKARWGDVLPGLDAYIDKLTKANDASEKFAAFHKVMAETLKTVTKAAEGTAEQILDLETKLELAGRSDVAEQLRKSWEAYNKEIAAGRSGAQQVAGLQAAIAAAAATGVSGIDQLTEAVRVLNTALRDSRGNVEELNTLFGGLPRSLGGAGPPPAGIGAETAAASGPSAAKEFLKGRAFGETEAARQRIRERIDQLDETFAVGLAKLFSHLPDSAQIRSAARTFQEQADIWERSQHGRLFAAAPPGLSHHEQRERGGKLLQPSAVDIMGVSPEELKGQVDQIKELETLKGKIYQRDKMHVQLAGENARVERDAAQATVDRANAEADAAQKRADAAAKGQAAYEKEIETQQRAIDQQIKHNNIMVDSSKTIDQRKLAVEADTIAQQLNQAAVANGITLTDALRAKHQELAMAMAMASTAATEIAASQRDAAAAAEEHKRAQEQLRAQLVQTLAGMATGALTGIVQDLRNGTDAATAFYNAISRIADQLLQMALQAAFKQLFGSLLGGLGGGIPLIGHAAGGYTGDRSTRAPAGIVHGQEFVINAQATRKHRDLLEAINRGTPGYASGGFVLPRISSMRNQMVQPSPASSNVDARTTVVNTFDAGSFLSEALSRPDGVKVILNAVRAQPGAFRQAMQS